MRFEKCKNTIFAKKNIELLTRFEQGKKKPPNYWRSQGFFALIRAECYSVKLHIKLWQNYKNLVILTRNKREKNT